MSMHKTPLSDLERSGLEAHRLPVDRPSQLADAFRQGMAWALTPVAEINESECDELMSYANAEGAEIGDYIHDMLYLKGFSESQGKTKEFGIAVNKELRYWLERFRAKSKIVTISEPQPDLIITCLEWVDE